MLWVHDFTSLPMEMETIGLRMAVVAAPALAGVGLQTAVTRAQETLSPDAYGN